MSVDALNASVFSKESFNAPEYISLFLKQIKPGEELRSLQSLRKLLSTRSNAAAETIKDIVFDHYKHFIETSKEISNLEREIYHLSSLLSEQKSLIENLMEMNGQEKKSTSSTSAYSVTSNSQNQLHQLMHKMDGVAAIINTLKDNERILLQHQMTLLNATNMESEHPILLVLLTTSLLIGYPTSSNGKYPFQMVANHLLEEVAIVNFKSHTRRHEDSTLKSEEHVLHLLVFPEQMYVRCENARQKREWLDTVEQVKRRQEEEKSLVRQATIRARRQSSLMPNFNVKTKTSQLTSSGRRGGRKKDLLPKMDEALSEDVDASTALTSDVQWLNDLIDELQVIISDRHMDQAVELLLEWKDCGCKDTAINAKFAALERQVVKILSDDVRRSGILHGGGSRITFTKPLALLTSLGRGVYAVDLYLRRRGGIFRSSISELVSEEPLSYVRQISTVFVNEILDVASEFSSQRQRFCLILQWASGELSVLLSMICRNVIEITKLLLFHKDWLSIKALLKSRESSSKITYLDFNILGVKRSVSDFVELPDTVLRDNLQVAPTITVLAHTWRILINNCDQLAAIGMDLSFEINRLLTPALTNALQINFNSVVESIVMRISEEKWKVYNLESESNLNRFLEEMTDFGLGIDWAICTGDVSPQRFVIKISQSACQFSRLAFSLSRDFALLEGARLEGLTDSFLQMLWCEYLLHLATASPSLVHDATARFIVSQVIPLCDSTYQTSSAPDGHFAAKILHEKFPALTKFAKTASFDEEIATV